jgi:hypothetical protein
MERIPMKTMIIASVAALSLGVGAAFAQGAPSGYQAPVYGSQTSTDHHNQAATQFLGPNTVLGKLFHHSSDNQVAAATSVKGS